MSQSLGAKPWSQALEQCPKSYRIEKSAGIKARA
jgi:hypothetical protein